MKDKDNSFTWSDGWWIEDDKAWFIGGMSNILFCTDLNTGECHSIAAIPETGYHTYRQTPYCLKCGRDIICIPGFGKSIWIYNLDSNIFTKNEIDKSEQFQMGSQFWIWEDKIFIISVNWNKVIEFNVSKNVIENYYMICEGDSIRKGVLAGNSIYMVSCNYCRIYQFDIITKETATHSLPNIEKRLFTICYDGDKFWLSGFQKEIYIWDKKNSITTTVNEFPENFGMYNLSETTDGKVDVSSYNYANPAFYHSILVGDYIWFISGYANKIIYVNKENASVSAFAICGEDETEKSILSWQRQGIGKYLLEYVRDGRYIGIFSAKCKRILEIDAKELKYQWKEFYFSDRCKEQCFRICKGIYYEGVDVLYDQAFSWGVEVGDSTINNTYIDSVGAGIHKTLFKEG